MSISRKELTDYINQLLDIRNYDDYCPNGLQVEGKDHIKKIAYAVSATADSIQKAVSLGADALIVHHGLFWKFHGARTITGAFAARIKPLVQHDINLLGYHLPLDGHIELGNAAALAKLIGVENLSAFGDYKGSPTGVHGQLNSAKNVKEFSATLENVLSHSVIVSTPDSEAQIRSVGIITGGASNEWIEAKKLNLDAYITGEISEHHWNEAQEAGVHYFAGGHYATEQFGIQSLLKHLHQKFQDRELEHFFIPSSNPA